MKRKTLVAAMVAFVTAGSAAAYSGTQTVVGLWDGMTIKTGNSWANIEVRAMSFGPGFCATHITVGDKTISVAAPPGTYSGWYVANSHGGSVSFEISKQDQCDTGTQAQVRYWRD